jgi:hypothetical protein
MTSCPASFIRSLSPLSSSPLCITLFLTIRTRASSSKALASLSKPWTSTSSTDPRRRHHNQPFPYGHFLRVNRQPLTDQTHPPPSSDHAVAGLARRAAHHRFFCLWSVRVLLLRRLIPCADTELYHIVASLLPHPLRELHIPSTSSLQIDILPQVALSYSPNEPSSLIRRREKKLKKKSEDLAWQDRWRTEIDVEGERWELRMVRASLLSLRTLLLLYNPPELKLKLTNIPMLTSHRNQTITFSTLLRPFQPSTRPLPFIAPTSSPMKGPCTASLLHLLTPPSPLSRQTVTTAPHSAGHDSSSSTRPAASFRAPSLSLTPASITSKPRLPTSFTNTLSTLTHLPTLLSSSSATRTPTSQAASSAPQQSRLRDAATTISSSTPPTERTSSISLG